MERGPPSKIPALFRESGRHRWPLLGTVVFCLVPMALLGIDIETLLARAHHMALSSGPFIPADTNVGASLGTALGMAAQQGATR